MLPDSQGGRGKEGDGRQKKDPERVRKTERGKIELPLPHIGNVNPSFNTHTQKKKAQVTVR